MPPTTTKGWPENLGESSDPISLVHGIFVIGYLVAVILLVAVTWRITKRLGAWSRVAARSGILALLFSPTLVGSNHGGFFIPFSAAVLGAAHQALELPNLRMIPITWIVLTAGRLIYLAVKKDSAKEMA